jgi:GNAT superfamily N-acetyltransferase
VDRATGAPTPSEGRQGPLRCQSAPNSRPTLTRWAGYRCRVELRTLSPDDWQLIREIRLRALFDTPEAFTSTLQRERAFDESTWRDRARTGQWFLATEEDESVGVTCGIEGPSADSLTRKVVGMWVAPVHRGHGIAQALVDEVAEWARSVGATRLSLGVREGNDGAREAYLRMGFHSTGETEQEWSLSGQSIEVMEMGLD